MAMPDMSMIMNPEQWHPGSNGAKKRHWFVLRYRPGRPQEQLTDRRGNIRWFGSFETAKRAAEKANAAEGG